MSGADFAVKEFLVCYDYGQGGIWLYLKAQSVEEIMRDYPRLTVFEAVPPFWTDELEAIARSHDTVTSQWLMAGGFEIK
jgi:hypothetical protein